MYAAIKNTSSGLRLEQPTHGLRDTLQLRELIFPNFPRAELEGDCVEDLKTGRTRKRRAGRNESLDHLPHEEVVIEPESKVCPCCGGELHVIGEDTSKRLDKVPAKVRVIVTKRPKYACRTCEKTGADAVAGIIQAAAPARLIEAACRPRPWSRMSWCRNTPIIFRFIGNLRSWRATASRSSDRRWPSGSAPLLPSCSRCTIVGLLRASRSCSATRRAVPYSIPGRQDQDRLHVGVARETGRGPASIRRRWPTPTRPDAAASTRQSCSTASTASCKSMAIQPKEAGCAERPGGPVTLAYCWSHLRRQFYEVYVGGNAPIATEALARIKRLYDIEAEIRGPPAEMRRAIRQERSRPVIEALKPWFEASLAKVSKGSKLAEALGYGLNQWDGLCRYLDDGRIEIDSNTVERSIRGMALTRKNALFAGHDRGAAGWAMIASLLETCKLNRVDPLAWTTDVLTKLVNRWPASRIDELMPWAYAAKPA